MDYKFFKDRYKYTLSKYPETIKVIDDSLFLELTTEYFNKKGSKWIYENELNIENMPIESYFNIIDAIPFFRNLGGYERLYQNYSKHGFLPYELISISPNRKQKVRRTMKIKDKLRED